MKFPVAVKLLFTGLLCHRSTLGVSKYWGINNKSVLEANPSLWLWIYYIILIYINVHEWCFCKLGIDGTYQTHDVFHLKCFMTPMCLLLIVWGCVCLVLFFPQIKCFYPIHFYVRYCKILENITLSWGDTRCILIWTSFTLIQACLLTVRLRGRKISPQLYYYTIWLVSFLYKRYQAFYWKVVFSQTRSLFSLQPITLFLFHDFTFHSIFSGHVCITWFAKYLHCLLSEHSEALM